jgi:uncharacterized protein (DUF427 family)
MLDRMSVRLRDLFMSRLGALRHEPIQKRIRAMIDEETVVDTTRAALVWEPGRVVPDYAVPAEDIAGDIVAAPDGRRPASGRVAPTSTATWSFTSAPSTRGTRRTSATSAIRATRFTGSTLSAARAMSGSRPTARSSGDVAWTYRAPLREAAEVTDRIAFFNERVDVVVDGERLERPVTPWS